MVRALLDLQGLQVADADRRPAELSTISPICPPPSTLSITIC